MGVEDVTRGDLLCRNSVIWVFAERDTEQSRFQISWCSRFYSISFQTRVTKKQAVILFSFINTKIEIEIKGIFPFHGQKVMSEIKKNRLIFIFYFEGYNKS